jgi:hypothetical protein
LDFKACQLKCCANLPSNETLFSLNNSQSHFKTCLALTAIVSEDIVLFCIIMADSDAIALEGWLQQVRAYFTSADASVRAKGKTINQICKAVPLPQLSGVPANPNSASIWLRRDQRFRQGDKGARFTIAEAEKMVAGAIAARNARNVRKLANQAARLGQARRDEAIRAAITGRFERTMLTHTAHLDSLPHGVDGSETIRTMAGVPPLESLPTNAAATDTFPFSSKLLVTEARSAHLPTMGTAAKATKMNNKKGKLKLYGAAALTEEERLIASASAAAAAAIEGARYHDLVDHHDDHTSHDDASGTGDDSDANDAATHGGISSAVVDAYITTTENGDGC